jgi:hypothetical protein
VCYGAVADPGLMPAVTRGAVGRWDVSSEYKDPSKADDQVDVDSWSANVGRTRAWYKPWTWRNSEYVIQALHFNRFQDEEVPTVAKRRQQKTAMGPTNEVQKGDKCWTEAQYEVFDYITRHYIKKRWIEYWRVNKTLEEYYEFVRDVGQSAEDLASSAKATAQAAGLRTSSPGAAPPSPGGVIATAAAGTALVAPAIAGSAALATDGFVVGASYGAGVATEAAAVVTSGVYAGATAAATLGSAVVTVTGQVLVPAIAITGTAVVAFVGTTRLMEKMVTSAEKISEGWEFVGTYDGKEELERQSISWEQVGPIRDCPKLKGAKRTYRVGGWLLPLWWVWLLAFVLALIALAAVLLVLPRSGSVTGGAPAPGLPTFKAELVAPSTIFTVAFPSGAPSSETYRWIGAIGCGTFVPFSKTPSAPVSGGPQATWTHPNAPPSPPDLSRSDLDGNGIPDFCPHSEVPNFSHPGTITVLLSDG